MVRVQISLSPKHVNKVKQLSKRMGLTVSDCLRRMIDDAYQNAETKTEKRGMKLL